MYITFSFSYPQFYISSGVIHGSVFYSVTNYHHGYHIVYIQYRLTLWVFFLYRYVVCNKCVCRKKHVSFIHEVHLYTCTKLVNVCYLANLAGSWFDPLLRLTLKEGQKYSFNLSDQHSRFLMRNSNQSPMFRQRPTR